MQVAQNKVAQNKVVSIEYTLTNPQGQVLDTSSGREPLAYIHGTGNIIPGLENHLEGKSQGDKFSVSVSPEQGYGPKNAELVQAVPRDKFRGVEKIEAGMQFQAQSPQGPRVVTVVAVDENQVTVDANHPLAGVTLNFEGTVVGVRDATAEELSHGHIHGPGGHDHH